MIVPKPKRNKATGNEGVDPFLAQLEHPLKEEIREVRRIILSAHPQLTEHIKWNAPSYACNGEDRVTFSLHGQGFFRLVFHCGAKAKNRQLEGRLIDDSTQLLEWVTDDRATARFTNMHDVREKEAALRTVIQQWIAAAE